MQTVEKSIIINSPLEKVYETMADLKAYPQYMPNIQNVNILGYDEAAMAARIEVYSKSKMLPKVMVSTQTLKFDIDANSILFEQVKGEMKVFRGHRHFERIDDNSIKFNSKVEFHYNDSMLAKMANSAIKMAVEANVDVLLKSVKERAEKCDLPVLSFDEIKDYLKRQLEAA